LGYLVFPLPGMLDDQKGSDLKDKMCTVQANILPGGNGHYFFAVNKVADFAVMHSEIARKNKSYLPAHETKVHATRVRYLYINDIKGVL
jgi:hypothetical protein